jgi:hypothetical protein
MSTKISIMLALLVIMGASPAAFAASAARHAHPARVHVTAPVSSRAAKQAYGYAWTRRHEPTYMGVEDQMDRDSLGE